jgi:outer membrane protein assembly factor BamB
MRKRFATALMLAAVFLAWVLLAGCAATNHNKNSTGADDDASPADDDEISPTPETYDYDVPVKSTSPWPAFRRTSHHTGVSPIAPTANDLQPWAFQTQKGLFLEGVIDEDGTIYIGSADTYFYAINPDGTLKWKFATGDIIDSTAILAADGTIFVPAGDGYLYALDANGAMKWKLSALGNLGFIKWWEGHIAMGHDGTLYAGNDDRHLYAVSQAGDIDWTYTTLDQVWSAAAVATDGNLYFGANDFIVRSATPAGVRRWSALTLGPVASSPMIYADGSTIVVGSFDGYVHAYDVDDGKELWTFAANDHIYATPALAADGTIYVGSADGTMYALNPDGSLKWRYDTLDPIRSSASIDADGNLYFGCGDGRLYCLRDDGTRLWSFDTTTSDRNNLNGSPVIGKQGLYIGGQSGDVYFVPFGYCESSGDPRCDTSPGEDIPPNGALLYFFTSGGATVPSIATRPTPAEVFTFRLVVRKNGVTVRARINPPDLKVTTTPAFANQVQVSADGNFLSVIPQEPLALNTNYSIALAGDYLVGGARLGDRVSGGTIDGTFAGSFPFQTSAPTGQPLPLAVTDTQATVLLFHRMAAPQPPMLATFNQIGFDSYNYLMSAVAVDPAHNRFILLAVEGTPGLAPTINYDTQTIFPMNGQSIDSYFAVAGAGLNVDVSGVSIALDLFRVAGEIPPNLTYESLNIYAEVTCADIQFFGFALELLGLCNPTSGIMTVNGTAMLAPQVGPEGQKPAGIVVTGLTYEATGGAYGGGWLEADFAPNKLTAAQQLPVILVIDETTGEAVTMNYGSSLQRLADAAGHLTGVKLNLPQGFDATAKSAIVVLNLYPIFQEAIP